MRPRSTGDPPLVMVQTADPHRYAAMLAVTAPNVAEYCRRRGIAYESFVGLRRGSWAWQASFNRIAILKDIVDRGHHGWAVYLDADAYVRDMDFDLAGYLAERERYGVIVATSTITDAPWDVNSGVVMINCRHPGGRRLVDRWAHALAMLSDEALHGRPDWCHPDDQDWLQAILREDDVVAGALLTESTDLINAPTSSFIRQRQRTQYASFDARLAAIAVDVAETMRAAGIAATAPDRGRAAARLLHPTPPSTRLTAAPVPPVNMAAAHGAVARWRDAPAADPPAHQAGIAALLAAGDAAGFAREVTALGRSQAAEGTLGGARQHRRAAADPNFARTRALRTSDALLSLAELTGAATIENPDLGPWGGAVTMPPTTLFAGIATVLAADLAPPVTIGGWLGVAVGDSLVVHQRMVEAIYAAWRLRGLLALIGGGGVLEFGGGVGLAAFYAARLGIAHYAIAAEPVDAILQRHVLGRDASQGDGPVAIAFCDDALPAMPRDLAVKRLCDARRRGARAFLSFNHEAATQPGATPLTAAEVAADAGGWRRVGRSCHGLRPGHVEELYIM